MNRRPLEGIKVIDSSTFVAAPICGRLLADLGAEVIKIEVFDGDSWRMTAKNLTCTADDENPLYDILNSKKKSICLNLKNPKGMRVLHKMLEDADIFLTNTRMQSLKKLGIDPDTLCEKYPQLIYASISGYGYDGPWANKPGFDLVSFWGDSGFLTDVVIDTPTAYPMYGPVGVGDSVSGTILLANVLAALYQRRDTGKGDFVTASLYHSALWVMNGMIIGGQERYGAMYPRKREECWLTNVPYKCADGEWLNIAIVEYDKYAARFYELLGISDLVQKLNIVTFDDMLANRSVLHPEAEKAFLQKTSAEWMELFKANNIVCGVLSHFKDVEHSPQVWANDYMEHVTFRNGAEVAIPCPPIRMRSQEIYRTTLSSFPGEDTDSILREHRFLEEEIREMKVSGAVKSFFD